jgi:hypothetical protein
MPFPAVPLPLRQSGRYGWVTQDQYRARGPAYGPRGHRAQQDPIEAAPTLGSVVGNLLHNAFKSSRPSGRVQLRARATADRVLIEVEDQCGGLPREMRRGSSVHSNSKAPTEPVSVSD